ncbi:Asp-tRNA(Asn)/Glu-tRNA(Gln) amidotransferase subunit GatA [Patescibacteria group bacterium]|nr:Asp-tRNA(Asn)/Glu-tRNA(Gln) amidotransferase subunit GatA [Patescibacteria group bacterium]MBU4458487.1 Asp-tRNA(Asn)/Glu-tRNA(Gln) amidotransferase subunit GatA [Patescibacteria group bacterium]MCG2696340.1 Asp-tRNA(Asn)/Glu-tRNA(Gln) amidotransferase subunit GatA [Candidatus Portnoybacteria bacterium]
MIDLSKLTIESAHKEMIKKEFTCTELIRACLDKIKKENKEINNFLEITEKLALEQAQKADDKIERGEKIEGLEGIPIAVKDNILVEDYKCTAGSKILENYQAPYDATVVKKLKDAGAIIIGKTNLDEFAMGSSTENSAFGVVKNPLDKTRVPGGSSGGSAAAVAAGHCLGALGSDTGGSVRQPASFCGIVGFKPSYGRVSRYGLIAMASSLDQIGTFGKTTADAKLIFDVIKGKDKFDSTTIEIDPRTKSKNLCIGVPKEYFGQGIDKQIKEKIQKAIKSFEKMGAKIKEVSLPSTEYALAAYYIIMPAEISANLARFDGIKYGLSAGNLPAGRQGKTLLENYLKTRAEGFGDEPRRRIMLGTYVLSAGYRDAYYNKAQKVRALIKKEFDEVFNDVDIILTPTAPTTAFKIGEKKDPLSMYLSDVYTTPVSLAGLPAISIPCPPATSSRSDGGQAELPVGLQIIGPQFYDEFVFEIANNFEHHNSF